MNLQLVAPLFSAFTSNEEEDHLEGLKVETNVLYFAELMLTLRGR